MQEEKKKLSFLLCEHPPAQSGGCCLWLGTRVSLVLCKHSVSPGSSLANLAHRSFTEAPWRYFSGCGTPGTGRAYGAFVTNKITVCRKQGTCERPDGLMVWFSYCSISPLQLHRKSLIISSYTGLLSLFRSLPHPLLWKLKFIFVTKEPLFMAKDSTAPAHFCSFTWLSNTNNIPKYPWRWVTQLQIPDGCSCKLNMSSASTGAFKGCFILTNDILVLRKKKIVLRNSDYTDVWWYFWTMLVTIKSITSPQ